MVPCSGDAMSASAEGDQCVHMCMCITNAEICNQFLLHSCAYAAFMVGISWAIPKLTDRHVAASVFFFPCSAVATRSFMH